MASTTDNPFGRTDPLLGQPNAGPTTNPVWNQERLTADANRAVGGALNLIREFSRINFELDASVSLDRLVKRVLFLAYELQALIDSGTNSASDTTFSERDRLDLLNQFLFKQKSFRCMSEALNTDDPSVVYRLNHILSERAGSATVIALIYAFLAERIGIHLEFVDLKPTSFLKWTERTKSKPRPCYIDIARDGAILSDDELIETLHSRFHFPESSICNASVLEAFTFETYLCDYLRDLKKSLRRTGDPEDLLIIQNTLISYQPSDLQLLGERAVLHRRLGNFKSALSDLKRFFAFHEKEKSPPEFVELYDELTQLLERNRV